MDCIRPCRRLATDWAHEKQSKYWHHARMSACRKCEKRRAVPARFDSTATLTVTTIAVFSFDSATTHHVQYEPSTIQAAKQAAITLEHRSRREEPYARAMSDSDLAARCLRAMGR
ncbi:hypothetical protein LY76DRAFT_231318 [Colletotrichum caudatum]|nr:hypothetical protein LY76DRAFT_231318 [Colletotrichum caudatum]